MRTGVMCPKGIICQLLNRVVVEEQSLFTLIQSVYSDLTILVYSQMKYQDIGNCHKFLRSSCQ